MYKITSVEKHDYPILVEIWEQSVRATHDFLAESDILFFKPLILNEYLDQVELRVLIDDEKNILGFIGVSDYSVEMLFILPSARGKGIGRQLLEYAINKMEAIKLEVNEQNESAHLFYLHMGFEVIGRTETDGFGKPYPLLQMKLKI